VFKGLSVSAVMGLTAALVLLGGVPSRADVIVKSHSGGPYGNYAVEGAWAERVVTLANHGDRPRVMKFAFLTDDPQQGKMQYSRVVTIPPGCSRRAHVAYRPGKLRGQRETASSERTQPVDAEQLYALWDARTGTQIPQKANSTIKLPEALTSVSLVYSERVPGDSGSYLKDLPGRQLGLVQLLTEKTPSNLPDRWYGYSMIEILCLGPIDMSLLRPTQVDALLGWVQRGGSLVLVGSELLAETLQGELGAGAGVSVVGHHGVGELAITGPGLQGVRTHLPHALPMVELQTGSAEVVYLANGLPLLTHNTYGHGQIMTLATPLGALADPSVHRVWSEVRWIGQSLPAIDPERFMGLLDDALPPGQKALQEIAGRRGASRTAPMSILLGLMFLVLGSGLVLRFNRRGELIWAVLIPAAVVMSVALYAYGRTLSDPQRLSHIGLISGLGGDRARVQQVCAYYSGPKDQDLNFSSGSENGLIYKIGTAAGTPGLTAEVRTAAGTVLPDQLVTRNSTSAFYVDTLESIGRIDSDMTFDSEGITGKIINRLGAKISDAVLYVNRRTYRIGELVEGENSVRITPEDRLQPGEFTGAVKIDFLRSALMHNIVSTRDTPDKRGSAGRPTNIDTAPLLIGYTPLNPLAPIEGRELAHQGWSIVTWGVRFTRPPLGSEVLIPSGLVDLEFKTTMWDRKTDRWVPSQYGGSVEIAARPGKPILHLDDAEATIFININATNFELIVSGGQMHPNGYIEPKTELRTFSNPTGILEVSVPDVARFTGPNGELLFHLRVKKLKSKDESILAKTVTCEFEDVEISLKGTVR